ncbi:hypothetical protein GYMLUDRAFT_64516 [Collybiopsis luxurians FD-317 M1]|uniref:Uncharacterized protein n=1 Tax=Collybiopsis luxurians FD-317 M1 TaxID=944289 RepID=A0A0D0AP64_9AGAR|nr:hypothetical protein GYMLUDRAFT_64516 [Collybiopsis luxurians FD-317 M1]
MGSPPSSSPYHFLAPLLNTDRMTYEIATGRPIYLSSPSNVYMQAPFALGPLYHYHTGTSSNLTSPSWGECVPSPFPGYSDPGEPTRSILLCRIQQSEQNKISSLASKLCLTIKEAEVCMKPSSLSDTAIRAKEEFGPRIQALSGDNGGRGKKSSGLASKPGINATVVCASQSNGFALRPVSKPHKIVGFTWPRKYENGKAI